MTDWNPDDDLDDGQQIVRLADGAETLLSKYPEFLEGAHDSIPLPELKPHIEPTEITVDLQSLESELREIQSRTDRFSTEMDPEAAVAVHQHVDVNRSKAADTGLWSAFSMLYFPWFVAHRWDFNGVSAMKKKFWTQGRALDSMASTFERLWWIAELTQREDDGTVDYEPTRQAFSQRRFVFRVFDIQMGRYDPAVRALLDVLYDEEGGEDGKMAPTSVINGTIQRFRKSGSVFPYEGQTHSELVSTLEEIRAEVESTSEGNN
jgi:hypothetical protein